MSDDQTAQPTWGCHINSYAIQKRKNQLPPGCPAWANWSNIEAWCETGVIAWSGISHKVHRLSGIQAVELLVKLEASDAWKTDGIVTIRHYRISRSDPESPKKSSKRSKTNPDLPEAPPAERKDLAWEDVEEEMVRFPPEAGDYVFNLLLENRQQLEKMAEKEREYAQQN